MDELTLRLTANEINVVLFSLSKQPYEAVAELIGKINAQAMAQIQERSQPASEGGQVVSDVQAGLPESDEMHK